MRPWDVLAAIFNRVPVPWQRRLISLTQPRFLVGTCGVGATPDGRVILARHRFGSPQWRLLGGFIERREALPDALAREIREETGLEIEVGPLLEASTGYHWARVEIVYAYRVTGGERRLSPELLELAEFTVAALPPLRADHRAIVERHAAAAGEWARARSDPTIAAREVR